MVVYTYSSIQNWIECGSEDGPPTHRWCKDKSFLSENKIFSIFFLILVNIRMIDDGHCEAEVVAFENVVDGFAPTLRHELAEVSPRDGHQ